jgi:hypothetical protein
MRPLLAAVGLLVAFALPANAQQLKLQIGDGRVTLDAVNVSARQILAEWAKIGGTTVVGAEKITGAALTLKLVDTPEQQALDIILRNVAGFMAAPRRSASTGASAYDRILVMATSANAAQASNATSRPGTTAGINTTMMNGTQRRVGVPPPRPPNLPPSVAEDADDADDQVDADPGDAAAQQQPVFTFPNPQGAPGAPGNNPPVFVPMQPNTFGAPGAGGTPVITLQPGPNGPTIYNFVPNQGTTPAPGTPTTPFGAVGAPTPGMIQVPQPVTVPGQPTQTRPPR